MYFIINNFKYSYIFLYAKGLGTYKTWDGQTYTGKWENDIFVKNTVVNIRYADKSVYTGLITNQMEYADDAATYRFYDGSKIKCKFVRNIPTEMSTEDGKIIFTDPNGIQWDNELIELESDENALILCLPNTFVGDKSEREESPING